jgi:hypothetical protein
MNFDKGTNIEFKIRRINEHQERVANISNQNKSIAQQFRAALTAGPVIKPLGISLGVMLFQETTGINAIIFYTVSIFQTAGSTIESRYATIIVCPCWELFGAPGASRSSSSCSTFEEICCRFPPVSF